MPLLPIALLFTACTLKSFAYILKDIYCVCETNHTVYNNLIFII